MSDEDPSTLLPVVDRPLQRRVAWGLLAGRTKAEIALAEGITPEELSAALTGPCMFMLINIWGVFFKEGDRGDMLLLRLLVRWALDFVLENADRAQGAGIAKVFLLKVSFKLGFNGTLKLLCDHIEGVIGVQDKRTPLHGVRGGLALVMAWAIEIALMQLFIYQMGEDEIVRRDEHFRAQILLQEFDAGDIEDEEDEIPADEATLPAVVVTPGVAEPFEPLVVGSGPTMTSGEDVGSSATMAAGATVGLDPAMTSEDEVDPGIALPWSAAEPAMQLCGASIPDAKIGPTRPRLVYIEHDVAPVERPPILRSLLYDSVRYKRRRRSSPLLVRHGPIERAA